MSNAKMDENSRQTLTALSNANDGSIVTLWADPTTHRLLVDLPTGSGTVTSVSVTTANGVSGSVATATTTPAITLTLGAITPTTVNGLTISTTTGTFTLTNGKTFAVTNGLTLSGTDSTVMTFPTTSATIARTDAANTFTGASTASAWVLTSPTITTKISPTADDGAPLGDTTHNFSDLFLATGAVTNYANGNVVLTHSSGILTMGTGEMRVTTVGTNTASVVTVGGTQTLTAKTVNLTDNTLTGTIAQFNTALSDGDFATLAGTETLTNKRITQRVVTTTDDATAVIDVAVTDVYELSAIANNTAFSFTGSPTDGQKFIVRYKDAGVSKTLTWTGFVAIGVTLPAATTVSKWGYVGVQYNAAAAAYHAIAVTTEA